MIVRFLKWTSHSFATTYNTVENYFIIKYFWHFLSNRYNKSRDVMILIWPMNLFSRNFLIIRSIFTPESRSLISRNFGWLHKEIRYNFYTASSLVYIATTSENNYNLILLHYIPINLNLIIIVLLVIAFKPLLVVGLLKRNIKSWFCVIIKPQAPITTLFMFPNILFYYLVTLYFKRCVIFYLVFLVRDLYDYHLHCAATTAR